MSSAAVARIPGSKSITNRALLLAAAAAGRSRLVAPLESEDTLAFRAALGELGIRVTTETAARGEAEARADGEAAARAQADAEPAAQAADEAWVVEGAGGAPTGLARIWCADAGTAARFLPVLAAAGRGEFRFEGSEQLTARPLRPLVEALERLGAEVEPGAGGGLPLVVRANGLRGGELALDASTSSQYLTGLLLSAPLLPEALTVDAAGLVSRPYIAMTLALLRRFGATATETERGALRVEPGGLRGTELRIEPDASTASYVFAAAAITGNSVTVPHLGAGSLQGDLRFVEVLAKAGARVEVTPDGTTVTGTGPLRGGFDVDMGDISDTFMTLAAVAPLADAPITVRGIGHARLKESDRIAAIAGNLRAAGVCVDEGPDWITVHPRLPRPFTVACHRDHRIAMAFSVLGLRVPGIALDDPACVGKTFPGFHQELRRLFGPQASAA